MPVHRELHSAERRRRWWIVALLFAAILINYIHRNNVSVAAVPIMDEFGFSVTTAGALMSAFYWTYTVFQIPSGWAVDRFGLRWTYALAFLVWSFSSGAIGLARSFAQIIWLRIVLGMGQAAAQPVSLTYIRTHFRASEQGMPTGLYISGMMIGPAFGGLLAGMLLENLGWRQMLVLTGLIPCVWIVAWLPLAPAGRVRQSPDRPKRIEKIPVKSLFSNPVVPGLTITAFFYSYFWYFCMSWMPSYLVLERDFSYFEMGVYTALPFVAMAVVSPVAGRIADRWIERTRRTVLVRKVFVISGYLIGSTMILINWVDSAPLTVAILIFGLAGIGLTSANYWALTQAVSPRRLIGRAVGYQNTVSNLAGICAPVITGALVERSGSFNSAIAFASVSLWIAALSYALLVREKPCEEIKTLFRDRV